MTNFPRFYYDHRGGKLILEHMQPPPIGYSQQEFVVLQAALTWPTVISPAYFCIFGLQRTVSGKLIWRLFAERESKTLIPLLEMLARCYHNIGVPIDCHARVETPPGSTCLHTLKNYMMERGAELPVPSDSTAYDDPVAGIQLIKIWLEKKCLFVDSPLMPGPPILIEQLRTIENIDINEVFEERFYAIAALIRIIGAYERYPWLNDDGKPFDLANSPGDYDDDPGVEYFHTR